MIIHPCCGRSLQTGVKVVVYLEIVTSLFFFFNSLALIVVALGLAAMHRGDSSDFGESALKNTTFNPSDIPPFQFWTNFPNITNKMNKHNTPNLGISICGIVLFTTSFITLLLTSKLWKGAENKNIEKCQTWLIIRTTLVLISAATFTTELFFGLFSTFFASGASTLFSRTGAVVHIVVTIYCIWVVLEFIQELKTNKSRRERQRGCSNYNYAFQNVLAISNG